MARTYAGILGSLAMSVATCRGVIQSAGIEGTLGQAMQYLVLFAIAGAILGHIAQLTIDESVQTTLQQQLAEPSRDG